MQVRDIRFDFLDHSCRLYRRYYENKPMEIVFEYAIWYPDGSTSVRERHVFDGRNPVEDPEGIHQMTRENLARQVHRLCGGSNELFGWNGPFITDFVGQILWGLKIDLKKA